MRSALIRVTSRMGKSGLVMVPLFMLLIATVVGGATWGTITLTDMDRAKESAHQALVDAYRSQATWMRINNPHPKDHKVLVAQMAELVQSAANNGVNVRELGLLTDGGYKSWLLEDVEQYIAAQRNNR